jgi:hypothetical protein
MKIFIQIKKRIPAKVRYSLFCRICKRFLGNVMIGVNVSMRPGFVLEGFILPAGDWTRNTRFERD